MIRLNINGNYINYVEYGKGKPIVLLHGWGQNIEMMEPIGKKIKGRIIIIDLPGHGKSSEPKTPLTIEDYADSIHTLLNKLKVEKPIIIGHSFGGRIGLFYASKYEVEKLVCLASPYKKQIAKQTLKTKILKTAKKIPLSLINFSSS